jgi:hypothetical protein
MSDKLPSELVQHIIGHLRNDILASIACSLVCRTWAHASRHNIFHSIDLHSPLRGHKLFTLILSNPHLLRYGRQVSWHFWDRGHRWQKHVVVSLLDRLSGIQGVEIIHRQQTPREKASPGTVIFQRHLPATLVTRLRLDRTIFQTFVACCDFLSTLCNLQELSMTDTRWLGEEDDVEALVTLPRLRTLELVQMTHQYNTLLCCLSRGAVPAPLGALTLDIEDSQDNIEALSNFLTYHGPSLQHLTLNGT